MRRLLEKNKFQIKDEYYTPSILVEPILPYLPKDKVIWCPFDTQNSEFVLLLREKGYNVIHSHIKDGLDFFTYTPDNYDIIVSNPPFSIKLEVLERLYTLNKPFAVLMGLPVLNYQNICNFFLNKPLQLLIVDKKVSFDGRMSSFNTSYFCNKLLPKDIIFTHIENNNVGKNYIPSRMYKDMQEGS